MKSVGIPCIFDGSRAGATVALQRLVIQRSEERTVWREDGFGARRFEQDGPEGHLEVLALSPLLATEAGEQAIAARAARLDGVPDGILGRVLRIARDGDTFSITTAIPEGVSLADLLAALEFGTVTLNEIALLELAGATIRTVAALHDLAPGAAHGALMPAHVHIGRSGRVLLSGALFGEPLQALHYNREQLWRTFGIALPPSATLPRFDQRADVTQLGAIVLAILQRRALGPAEYPRGVLDLTGTAAEHHGACAPGLRMWLQQALQLHPKALFSTAADASRAFEDAVADVPGRRVGAQALAAAVRTLCGEPERPDPLASLVRLRADTVHAQPLGAGPAASIPPPGPGKRGRGPSLLRAIFPALG